MRWRRISSPKRAWIVAAAAVVGIWSAVLTWMEFKQAPAGVVGPFAVETLRIEFNSPPNGRIWPHPRIRTIIWCPAVLRSGGNSTRVSADADPQGKLWPLVIYAPGWGGGADDNAIAAHNLASRGFVVIAFDDIAHDLPFAAGVDEAARVAAILFDTENSQAQFIANATRRVILESDKASRLIDALEDGIMNCGQIHWGQHLDTRHVGMLGNSFGGAVAAQLAGTDQRIAAVVNLDGWLYGAPASQVVTVPFMVFNSVEVTPESDIFRRFTSGRRFERRMNEQQQSMQRRQAELADAVILAIPGAKHSDFSIGLNYPLQRLRRWRPWWGMPAPPRRIRSIVDTYLTAFFSAHLRYEPQSLADLIKSPPRGARVLRPNVVR